MQEVVKQKGNRINCLRYFDQAVQEQFKSWQAANVGKANNNQTNPHDQNNTMQSIKSEFDDLKDIALKELIDMYSQTNLPPACKSIPKKLHKLKTKSFREVEDQLMKIRKSFEKEIVKQASHNQITETTKQAQKKTGYKFSNKSIKPMIISNLFDKFKLKPLTLFRF